MPDGTMQLPKLATYQNASGALLGKIQNIVQHGEEIIGYTKYYLLRAIDSSDDRKTWCAGYEPRIRDWDRVEWSFPQEIIASWLKLKVSTQIERLEGTDLEISAIKYFERLHTK